MIPILAPVLADLLNTDIDVPGWMYIILVFALILETALEQRKSS